MHVKIFTIPFLPESGGFDSSHVEVFCENHEVISQEPVFFQENGRHWWSIYMTYKPQVEVATKKAKQKLPEMNEGEQVLFHKLKKWRKTKAEEQGFPPYLVATDRQFAEMILKKCRTKQSLEEIKGFGKKRITNYGADILNIIKDFMGDESKSRQLPHF